MNRQPVPFILWPSGHPAEGGPDSLLPFSWVAGIEDGLFGPPVTEFIEQPPDRTPQQVFRFQQCVEAPVCSGFRVGES